MRKKSNHKENEKSSEDAIVAGLVNNMLEYVTIFSIPLQSLNQVKEGVRIELTDLLSAKKFKNRIENGYKVIMTEISAHETPLVFGKIQGEFDRYLKKLIENVGGIPRHF